jgi:ribosomal protein S3AE
MWQAAILLEDYHGLEVTGVEDLKTQIKDIITTINRGMLVRTWEELEFRLDVLCVTRLKCTECRGEKIKKTPLCMYPSN